MIGLTEPKDVPICHAIRCLWFIFSAEWVWDPRLCWRWQSYSHCMDDHSTLSVDTAGHVNYLN